MTQSPAKLVVLEGKYAGRIFEIKGPTVLGRVKGVGIPVPDVKVSREHSKIFPQGSDYFIVDLNSRNGTLVNDAKITRRQLRNGDEVLLGGTRFRFELAGSEADPETAAPVKPKSAPVREVVDLTARPAATPAGSIRADEIVVKDKALQFSKKSGRKKPSMLFDDIGQKNFAYQLLMFLLVAGACIVCLLVGLYLGGIIGAD